MSKPWPVRANVSFGAFRAGKVYEVDLDDQTMLSLLGVGYLTSAVEEDEDAGRGVGEAPEQLGAESGVPGADVLRGVHLVGSSESEAVDVNDQAVEVSGAAKRPGKSVRGGKASDGEGAARSEGPGPSGDA